MNQSGSSFRSANSAPRFASHFRSLQHHSELNSTVNMFTEDIYKNIMPIGGRSRNSPDFDARLEGESQSNERASRILQSLAIQHTRSPEALSPGLLGDAVRSVAARLAARGRAVYELTRDERGHLTYQLQPIPLACLHRVFRSYVQIIPKADREFHDRSYSFAPVRDIWRISIPEVLGGYRGHHKIVVQLGKLPQPDTRLLLGELANPESPSVYDWQRHVKETTLREAQVTLSYGWHHRDYSDSRWTEFYLFHRITKFSWAQACIREHIIDEINSLFQRLNLQVRLVVTGLPTASEILALRQQMRNGRISFTKAYKSCSAS